MVCRNCGKELEKIGELTEQEVNDFTLINSKDVTVYQALDPDTINKMKFTDGQVFEYFRAAFEAKATSEFLKYVFFKNLKKRLDVSGNIEIEADTSVTGFGVYVHKE